jgi:hypothetical protein
MRAALSMSVLGALVLVLALVAASAPAAAPGARPTACSLLADGVKAAGGVLVTTDPDPGNNAISCSRSDGKPVTKRKLSVSFFFVPYPPKALDKAWAAVVKQLRSGKNPATRLRGFGADDAFLSTGSTHGTAGRLEHASIAWRKGVYIGGLSVTEPSASASLDDLDERAPIILRGSLRRLPRR